MYKVLYGPISLTYPRYYTGTPSGSFSPPYNTPEFRLLVGFICRPHDLLGWLSENGKTSASAIYPPTRIEIITGYPIIPIENTIDHTGIIGHGID
ncbi:MAG: hypothetical protein OXH16_09195 [Gemmatimonadetes bacterium]|nr:hypothetical protein [Gemmatimonadota bacterium]